MPPADSKPTRNYLRVPEEMQEEVETIAARCDVPVRSVTRLLISIGLEAVHMHPDRALEILKRHESPPASPPAQVRATAPALA